MKDIFFDFDNNDISISNGDFMVTADASRQNGGLFLMKSPVNVYNPQFGVGFESWSADNSQSNVLDLISEAKKQILADGAISVKAVSKAVGISGATQVELSTAY